MYGLSSCFEEAVSKKEFQGFSIGNIFFTHLLYADDLFVFGKATMDNANTLNNILLLFAEKSQGPIKYLGLHIHTKKIHVVDFQPLITKIFGALDGWKAKSLSLAAFKSGLKTTMALAQRGLMVDMT
ncbi:uncharacterized protein LOC110113740 [Dendrobium catenatum]|uniref:uncharacterized protein LOC110113740 n=1 Tax=Dendrobium catenatum TaxID=906689 RepID=UPI0009F59D1B|nr:uncharacterized protein LOC110113740 [Dendrobium catenatum]